MEMDKYQLSELIEMCEEIRDGTHYRLSIPKAIYSLAIEIRELKDKWDEKEMKMEWRELFKDLLNEYSEEELYKIGIKLRDDLIQEYPSKHRESDNVSKKGTPPNTQD